MRINLKILLLASASVWAHASFAETAEQLDVPFSFTAQGESFPAGQYRVELGTQQGFIAVVSRTDTAKRFTVVAGPADRAKYSAVMRFDVIGSDYVLETVQLGGRISRNLGGPSQKLTARRSVSIRTP